MVKPAAKRKLVSYVRETYEVSTRRACRLFNLWESSLYYKPKGRDDKVLRTALTEHATNHPGWDIEVSWTGWSVME